MKFNGHPRETNNEMVAKKIAIIGGGLVGRLLAWRLATTRNHEVSQSKQSDYSPAEVPYDNGITYTYTRQSQDTIAVFEKGLLQPTSVDGHCERPAAFTAAAMISPLSELVASDLAIYNLGLRSLKLWPAWLSQLGSLQHFHQYGSLVLAHPNDAAELQQFQQDLTRKLSECANDDILAAIKSLANRQDLAQLEPALSQQFNNGFYLPLEAHIDHDEVLAALVSEAKQLGVCYNEGCPLDPDDAALKDYDLIFDCRGMGLQTAPSTASDLRGVRGEIIRIECKDLVLTRPIRIMHPRYKLYVVPKPNQQFVIGATEIESEDRSPVSVRSAMELMSALYAINPAFAEARIVSQESNLRPAYMNNLPRIDTLLSKYHKPIIRINGLYRHGYLAGPAVIEQALEQAFL